MSFVSFSSEQLINNTTSVDNSFINDFLPIAPECAVKVYLFGLYNCVNNTGNNTVADFARILKLSEEDVLSAFYYWKEMGLVQILSTDPIQVKYLPVKYSASTLMKFDKNKYKDFNLQAQDILTGRQINPNEYQEYYYLVESMHVEIEALLMVIKYCVNLKGNNVNYKYIIAVAKNWAYQGITTAEKVEEKLKTLQASDSDMKLVLQALGLKRTPTLDDYEMFVEWSENLGFETSVIVSVAKKVKATKGGLNRLNALIQKFYTLRLTSIKEIDSYLAQEKELYTIAKNVCRNIGVRYDNLEVVVETYVSPWVGYGYDADTLNVVSLHCFKMGIKRLEDVNLTIQKFYKLWLVTTESLNNYLESNIKQDQKIAEILQRLNIVRHVNMYDREYYNTWLYTWKISDELIDYAIDISKDKAMPMQFLNKILSIYHTNNIDTIEKAKEQNASYNIETKTIKPQKVVQNTRRPAKREYTKEELSSLFVSMSEVEI